MFVICNDLNIRHNSNQLSTIDPLSAMMKIKNMSLLKYLSKKISYFYTSNSLMPPFLTLN